MLASREVEELPWTRRMVLRMHARLCRCSFCRSYAEQVLLMRSMCRTLAREHDPAEKEISVQLSPEARQRIAARLRNG